MFPSVLRLVVAFYLVRIKGAVGTDADFELLGGGYCHGTSGTLVAGLLQGASAGWQTKESLEACQAQCAKDASCDGFEFEVDGKKCRLLKGSVAKASGDHGPFRQINCYVNSRKVNAAKTKADAAKKREADEAIAPTCNMFVCPSGQKRAPKRSSALWSYGCANCPNEATLDCCISRDICLRTCGMASMYCYSSFVQCLVKACAGDDQCMRNSTHAVHEFGITKEDRCAHYEDAQVEACECVAEADFRTSVEQWLEGFYAKHQPDKLDDSNKLQNRDQIWKKWANKEPELLLALVKKRREAVEQRSADEAEMHYLGAWRKNAIAEEDYMTAKRIKRREALVAKKMEALGNGTADDPQPGAVKPGGVGTLREFDKLAAIFMTAADKKTVLADAKAAESDAKDKEAAAYYIKAMEKSIEKEGWAEKEHTRLTGMIGNGDVAADRKGPMQLKINRLSAFVSPREEL